MTDRTRIPKSPLETLVTQVGIVVEDLQKTMDAYEKMLGWGPWHVYELGAPNHHDTHLRGEPVDYSMRIAVAMVGDLMIELVEPIDGPSIYKEHLEQHGEGVQHIAVGLVAGDQLEEDFIRTQLESHGLKVVMGGQVGANLHYGYLDAMDDLKLTIETYRGEVGPPTYIYSGGVYGDPDTA